MSQTGTLVIAAPASGQGKTLVTFGLLRALRNKGLKPTPFKTGPDYIDPHFHQYAANATCTNLDPWAMSAERIKALVAAADGISIIEGVMGLFDGAANFGLEPSSTADLAIQLGAPVVLVVDCKGMAQSVAALVHGFQTFNPALKLTAVILNRVASPKHEAMLKSNLALPVLGCLPKLENLQLESRHLGLVQAQELEHLEELSQNAGRWIEDHVDLDAIAALAGTAKSNTTKAQRLAPTIKPLGQHIAVAKDTAFAFAYPHVLADWRKAGSTLSFFSPLANQAPDPQADAVYLPGGYPELHADRLASNTQFLDGLRKSVERGCWIYGECGGFMVLGDRLVDANGKSHVMAGLLPISTSFAKPKRSLGYRRFQTLVGTPFGPKGHCFCGHEFHYSSLTETRADAKPQALFQVEDAMGTNLGPMGAIQGRVLGSYLHLIDAASQAVIK